MTLRVVGSAAGASTSLPLLDLVEVIGGGGFLYYDDVTTAAVWCEVLAGGGQIATNLAQAAAVEIYPSGAGAGPAAMFDGALGLSFLRQACQAGSVNARSGTNTGAAVRMPMYQQIGAVGFPPTSSMRPFRSYLLQQPLRLNTVGLASNFFGVWRNTGVSLGILPQFNAYCVVSDPGLNGGAWTAAFRQADGGAIVTLASSGVVPNAVTWHNLGVRYTEGNVPKFEWLMDGVPFAEVSGIANMPITAVGQRAGMYPCVGCTQAAPGTLLDQGPARFTVEEV